MESVNAGYGLFEEIIHRFSNATEISSLIAEYKSVIENLFESKYTISFVFENLGTNQYIESIPDKFILSSEVYYSLISLFTNDSKVEKINQINPQFDYAFKIGNSPEIKGFSLLSTGGSFQPALEEIQSIIIITEFFNLHLKSLISSNRSIQHEHKYKQLVEESTDIIYLCDVNGNFKYINPYASKVTGYSKEEIIGQNFLSFIRKDFEDHVRKFYQDQVVSRIFNTYLEYPVLKKDGTDMWLGQNVQIIEENGVVIELQAVARDITERKKAERLLIESEARFQTLSKNGHAAIFLTDLKGNLTYVNEKWYEFTGMSEEDALGLGYLNALYSEDKEYVIREWQSVLEGNDKELEFRMVNVNGNIVWVYGKAGAVKGENNEITGYIGTLIDVGERKKAIRFAEETNQKMQAVFNHSYDGIFLVDPVTRVILDCNDRSVELFDAKSKNDLIGKFSKDLRKFQLTESEDQEINRKLYNKEIFSDEVCYVSFKGREFWGGLAIKLINIGDKVYLLVRMTDVTDRKTIEQELIRAKVDAESAMKAREQFLSVVSHEIRTPLNAIMGMTEWLIQDKPRNSQMEFLQGIKYSSENLLKLINEILDFSKIESGKILLEEIEFSMNTVLNNIYKTFKLKAEEKKLDFSIVQNSEFPSMVLGDPGKLTQILINLIGNAIKFTEKGSVKLVISCNTRKGKNWFKFEVQDTGIGIPKEKIDFVFESFTQASNDTTRKYGGSGLGLTISKKLVELQNGTIDVATEPGIGSVFTVEIPFKTSQNLKIVNQKEPEYNLFQNINVLLVEDNQMNQLLTTTFLQKWNVQVKVAENGQEAIEKISKESFDIVFMDLHMPTMDGFEATKYIRNQLNLQELPIIALTASVLLDVREKVIGSGMNDYITKPFKPFELNAKLSMHLPHKISAKKA